MNLIQTMIPDHSISVLMRFMFKQAYIFVM